MKKIGLITDKSNEMELLACPSETLMVIEAVESKSSVEGVPDNNPDEESKDVHEGFPAMLKAKSSPSISFAEGIKSNTSPTLIVEILPEIVGAVFCITGFGLLPPPHELIINKVTRRRLVRFIKE